MIFVSVGTQKFQMNRLLSELDSLVGQGVITEEVFAQRGSSDYIPKNFETKEFLSKEEFGKKLSECSLLVTHSGVATIMEGIKQRKPVVVVPRLAKYGEHVDDHQKQIAESFSEKKFVLTCPESESLGSVIKQAEQFQFSEYVSMRGNVLETINNYIASV